MNFLRNPAALIILLILVVLLFGAGKLPGLARNLGKSMRIFKTEVEELRGDEKNPEGEDDDAPRRPEQRPARGEEQRSADRSFDPREDAPADRDTVTAREDDNTYRRD